MIYLHQLISYQLFTFYISIDILHGIMVSYATWSSVLSLVHSFLLLYVFLTVWCHQPLLCFKCARGFYVPYNMVFVSFCSFE
jgi:hypothetical protein